MDKPVEEIARQADVQIQLGFTIWQKWTCLGGDLVDEVAKSIREA